MIEIKYCDICGEHKEIMYKVKDWEDFDAREAYEEVTKKDPMWVRIIFFIMSGLRNPNFTKDVEICKQCYNKKVRM